MRRTTTKYITARVGTLLTRSTSSSAQVSLPRLLVSYHTGMLNNRWIGSLNDPSSVPMLMMLLVSSGP